jgi:hypothetical protein
MKSARACTLHIYVHILARTRKTSINASDIMYIYVINQTLEERKTAHIFIQYNSLAGSDHVCTKQQRGFQESWECEQAFTRGLANHHAKLDTC